MEKGDRGIMRMLIGLVSCMLMLLGGVVVLAVVLWWLLNRTKPQEAPQIEIEVPTDELVGGSSRVDVELPSVASEPAAGAEAEPRAADNLERVEGIGPKIAGLLRDAGIVTFAQLAATEVSRIEQILEDASPRLRRLAHPETWPEQASLAAGDDWEALEALQRELKGGRRVDLA